MPAIICLYPDICNAPCEPDVITTSAMLINPPFIADKPVPSFHLLQPMHM